MKREILCAKRPYSYPHTFCINHFYIFRTTNMAMARNFIRCTMYVMNKAYSELVLMKNTLGYKHRSGWKANCLRTDLFLLLTSPRRLKHLKKIDVKIYSWNPLLCGCSVSS